MKKTIGIILLMALALLTIATAQCPWTGDQICQSVGFDSEASPGWNVIITGFHGDEPMIDFTWDAGTSDADGIASASGGSNDQCGFALGDKSGSSSAVRSVDKILFCKFNDVVPNPDPVGSSVPEFNFIAGGIALAGSGLFYLKLRRR